MAKRVRPAWLRTPLSWFAGAVLLLALQPSLEGLAVVLGSTQGPLHDTYPVVAERHHVVSLGAAFGLFAAFYLWCETGWGSRYDARLGQAHVWLMSAGAALAVLPGSFFRLMGMPHRFEGFSGSFELWNRIPSVGYGLMVLGLLVFGLVCIRGLWAGRTTVTEA